MLAATGWEMFPTWKDLEAFPTWKDLADLERRAEQKQQQMWLECTGAMRKMQAQVHDLECRLLRLEEREARRGGYGVQWLPELVPELPMPHFIPHWSAAVFAAEMANPIDLTQNEKVLVAIAKLTEEAIREVGDDLPILVDQRLDLRHMAEVGWSPIFTFAYLLFLLKTHIWCLPIFKSFLLLGGPRSKFSGLRFGLCGIISTCATENTHEQAPSRT